MLHRCVWRLPCTVGQYELVSMVKFVIPQWTVIWAKFSHPTHHKQIKHVIIEAHASYQYQYTFIYFFTEWKCLKQNSSFHLLIII